MDQNWKGNSLSDLFNQLRYIIFENKKICSNYILLKYGMLYILYFMLPFLKIILMKSIIFSYREVVKVSNYYSKIIIQNK